MTHTMTCEQFEAALPRLLDGEIEMTPAMQAHLQECTVCSALLVDLKSIQAKAATLATLEPEHDLWAGISARIEAPVVPLADGVIARSRRQLTWRTASIAAAALVLVTTGITYKVATSHQPSALSPQQTTASNQPPETTNDPRSTIHDPRSTFLPASYDAEVSRLHAIVDSNRRRLDPATVALLERNLRMIDSAIVQCRDALAKDPGSKFLMQSLNDSYTSKVRLLRMAAAATKG